MNINATLIGQTLSFLVFVWFCKRFVWPKMIFELQKRQTIIADGLAAAEKGQQAETVAKTQAAELIDKAKAQATEIIAKAEKRSGALVEEAKQTATSEKSRIVDSAQSEVEQSVHAARESLRQQVSSIAILAAEKIAAKEIDEAQHEKLLTELTNELKVS